MRKVKPTAIDQAVVIPGKYQTGVVLGVGLKGTKVALDSDGKAVNCEPGEAFVLRWHERRLEGDFLVIGKAWSSHFGKFWGRPRRVVRLQSHQIINGMLGRRWIMAEYHNGKPVKIR